MLRVPLALLIGLGPLPASAQTVRDIAGRGACSTAGVEGLSNQLAEAQMCLRPDRFVRFAPHAGISLTSSRVHPYVQASARDAIHRAAGSVGLSITSAFRTIADQYVLYHSGACGLAATPGRSNHQSGRAIDVSNYSAARSALTAAGCTWLGSSDPVHFDCPGVDGRPDSILAFQQLWNTNHPGDRIAEDGLYGPQTDSRLASSPAGGFPTGGCAPTCTPHCEGTEIVGADCGRGDCAAFGATCSTAGVSEPRCVSVFCVADPSEVPVAHDVCLPDGRLASCTGDGALADARDCPAGTSCDGAAAACVAPPPPEEPDAGVPPEEPDAGEPPWPEDDAGWMPDPDGGSGEWPATGRPEVRSLTGGCAAGGAGGGGGWLALLIVLAVLRRRR